MFSLFGLGTFWPGVSPLTLLSLQFLLTGGGNPSLSLVRIETRIFDMVLWHTFVGRLLFLVPLLKGTANGRVDF